MHWWVAVLRHPREASNKDICAIWFLGQRQKNDIIIVSCKWGKGRKNPKPQKPTNQPKPHVLPTVCQVSQLYSQTPLYEMPEKTLSWEPRAKQYFTNKTHPLGTPGTTLMQGRNCTQSQTKHAVLLACILLFQHKGGKSRKTALPC